MRKRRLSMSQAVLARKRERRNRHIRTTALVLLLVTQVWLQISLHHTAKKRLAVAKKQAQLITAPSWADFQIGKGIYEVATNVNNDGVPEMVIINGDPWSIVKVDAYNTDAKRGFGDFYSGTGAETYCKNKTISYISTGNKQLLRINIMHEIFHAGDCLHGGDIWWNSEHPTSTYHPGVYHLGNFTATFLHDNPNFAIWMAE